MSNRSRQKPRHFVQTYKDRLIQRVSTRWHMALILGGVLFSGIIANKVLYFLGVRAFSVRYSAATVLAYLVFFALIRLWIRYIATEESGRSNSDDGDSSDDLVDWVDGIEISDSAAAGSDPFQGQGGRSGGGGANDSWGSDVTDSGAKSSLGSGVSADLDDGGIVLVLFALVGLVVCGTGIYLIYEAPDLLSEASFQVLLASGLVRSSVRMSYPGWVGSVFKKSCVPFFVVLGLSFSVGLYAQSVCPTADRISDVIRIYQESKSR